MTKGDKINQLTFLGLVERRQGRPYGKFRCECGVEKFIRLDQVKGGATRTCGHTQKNEFGMASSDYEKLYGVWSNMRKRCYEDNNDRYYAYGARGIRVCPEWKDSFRTFAKWAVENGWSPALSIERKDVDSNYSPSNCCFITMAEQMRNRTNNIRLTFEGEERCLTEWCEIHGVDFKRTWARLNRGWRDFEHLFYPGDLRDLRRLEAVMLSG